MFIVDVKQQCNNNNNEQNRLRGGSIMVWGGIAHGVKSHLIVVEGNMTAVMYRDEILRPRYVS